MPEALDLFSAACGGWSLGLHRAGFRTIAACEAVDWRRILYAQTTTVAPPGCKHIERIGSATLYLGDAYEIRPTLGWMDADVLDPPYAFNNSGGGAFRKARGASDQIVDEGLDQGFDHAIINPLLCGATVVFCHNDQLPKLLPYLDGGFHRFVVLFWQKPNPSPMANKHYLADTEPFIHAWNRGYAPQGGHHDKHRHVTAVSQPSKLYGHPTVKPDAVMDKIMRNVAGESVCDPFMGTGSSGVAAIRAGKRFAGIEKNEAHFMTAVERISAAVAGKDEK